MYCDPVQVIDIYLRLVKRVVEGTATSEEEQLANVLVAVFEIKGGLY